MCCSGCDTAASSVRANVIADAKLSGYGYAHDSRETGVSGLDEELTSHGTSSKGSNNATRRISDDTIKEMVASSGKKHLLTTEDLWKNESRFCMLLCDFQQNTLSMSEKRRGYEMFFLKNLLVAPNRFRPSISSSLGIMEHPQNVLLGKVQEANLALQQSTAASNHMDILRRWMDLQRSVNVLYDSTKGLVKSEKNAQGIRQLLEKKEGVLRQKMMGKRVNYACWSVISPDPYLAVNEIGIPPVFATRLTYPEKVTPWNARKLQEAIKNGADIHPGATHYRDNNNMYKLQAAPLKRCAIAKMLPASRGSISQAGKDPKCEFESKVVYRHLQDGDIVLVNRQSLNEKSKIYHENNITYNADFDGDEMNVHFPQDEISRAEAINIVDANKQYIGPRSGDAVRGLIQDHIVGAVLLTKLDTFLSREDYNQLVYGSCVPYSTCISNQFGEKISIIKDDNAPEPVPPAIWKPKPLWTGKQVITTILNHVTKGHPPFTVEQKGRISKEFLIPKYKDEDKAKDKARDPSEQVLYVHDNELVKGMIDKAQFGKYGIVHTVHELYGAETAGVLLSAFSRLFTMVLQLHGFTCGIDDLLLCQESDRLRKEILGTSEKHSKRVHRNFTRPEDDEDQVKLQMEVEKIIRRNGESATVILDRKMSSALNAITSKVNQNLFPYGLQKPFPGNCLSLMTATGAKGGLVNMTQISSLLGQQELEGKRVPRMVSGKTLPCFPPWDTSSRAGGFISDRFLTGLRPQEYYFHCMAGREGLVDTAVKTSRSGYLQRCLIKSLESLKVSYDHTVRDVDGSIIQFCYGEDGVDVLKTSFLDKFKELAVNRKAVLDKLDSHNDKHLLSNPNGYISKLPEKLIDHAMEFLKLTRDEKRCRYDIKKKELMRLLKVKYLASLVDPGEAVGCYPPHSELTIDECQETLRTVFINAMDLAISKHVDLLQKINDIHAVKSKDMESQLFDRVEDSESWRTNEENNSMSDGDADGENEDDLGADAEKRKHQEIDEIEYDDDDADMDSDSEEDTKDYRAKLGEVLEESEEGHVLEDSSNMGKNLKAKQATTTLQDEMNESDDEKVQTVKFKKNIKWTIHYESTVVKPEKKGSPMVLQTAGVNFEVFWNLVDYLNINEVKSNDIHAMLKTYGVEAARATIIQEVSGVFGAYGIDVNMRHLSMIADFMTFDGGYRPMSRQGMGQFSTSPFGKMTFETATKFIVEAASHGESDTLDCPSASVCLGKPVKMGTGSFGLMQNFCLEQPAM
ncbi:hypothetical protein ABZP36_035815 [Zizania latifolia]